MRAVVAMTETPQPCPSTRAHPAAIPAAIPAAAAVPICRTVTPPDPLRTFAPSLRAAQVEQHREQLDNDQAERRDQAEQRRRKTRDAAPVLSCSICRTSAATNGRRQTLPRWYRGDRGVPGSTTAGPMNPGRFRPPYPLMDPTFDPIGSDLRTGPDPAGAVPGPISTATSAGRSLPGSRRREAVDAAALVSRSGLELRTDQLV